MHVTRPGIAAALLITGALMIAPRPAPAAESYDNCVGFVDSLPATINTQGTWCLRQDLATSLSSGSVITVGTNNVTIDCNGFKIGGLAAGAATEALGIVAQDRLNTTIRNCNIRGFMVGTYLIDTSGTAGGHIVEDNRFDSNRIGGPITEGRGSVVRRNQVMDTGGSTSPTYGGTAYGIFVSGGVDVLDNVVDGVTATTSSDGLAIGIQSNAASLSATIAGNRIRNLVPDGSGTASGIRRSASGIAVFSGNHLFGTGSGTGIVCNQSGIDSAKDNVAINFATGIGGLCVDDGGNVVRNAPL